MQSLAIYLSPRMLMILLLGFSSGLPLALTGSTLSTWLSDEGIDIKIIGVAAAVAIPYSLKFLWSPLVDNLKLPYLHALMGRRRSWLVFAQILLFAVVALMSQHAPKENLELTLMLAVCIAVASATQDIVIDAVRVEMLDPTEYGHGTAMITLGYRIGMLVSGAGSLYLAEFYGWPFAYAFMAALVVVGVIATVLLKEPPAPQIDVVPVQDLTLLTDRIKARLKQSVVAPFADFIKRDGWLMILAFIALYKLGDAFLGTLTNPFLREIGFAKTDIAEVVKLYGFAATIAGTFAGAWVVQRFGIIKPLLIGGVLHAITNLMFLWQAKVGADPTPLFTSGIISMSYGKFVLALGITLENFTGGVSSAILVVFISSLCNLQFTATQYALLSSLATVGRTTLATSSGWFKEALGWEGFFVFSVILAIPSLIMLIWLKKYIMKEDVRVRASVTES